MNQKPTFVIALVVIGLLASRIWADGGNTWAAGYPKAGSNAGSILVKGTASLDTGFTFTGAGQVVYWPQGGGQVVTAAITVDTTNGKWGETTVTGLTTGVTYNVFVEANEKAGGVQFLLGTDPATVTAP
jgi:hypothetical protein